MTLKSGIEFSGILLPSSENLLIRHSSFVFGLWQPFKCVSISNRSIFDLQEIYIVRNGFEEGLTNSDLGCSGITQASAIFTIFGETEELWLFVPQFETIAFKLS